jgi:glutamine amidotransferase
VGAFDTGCRLLDSLGFIPVLNQLAFERRIPILGICLGMQLMTLRSDEGTMAGLGWVDAETLRFDFDEATRQRLRIPHMGWDDVVIVTPGQLFNDWQGEARFYFVHSYRVICRDPGDVVAMGHHGHEFVAAFQHGNIMGVQFHPEKSHRFGMELLKRFARGE